MNTIKFGNVEFKTDDFSFKSKQEFMNHYKNPVHVFDREKAWKELRKHIPKIK